MELEDIKDRYKLLPIAARIGVAFIIGILPIVYIFLDEGSILNDQLVELQGRESQTRAKFEKDRDRKANLPKLEENLAFTEEQLNKAKKLLPEAFHIEEVLQKVATTARDVGVSLDNFKPLEEVKKDIGYPTVEISILAEVTGRFGDIGNFIDSILRSEMSLFVKSMTITLANEDNKPKDSMPSTQVSSLSARDVRQRVKEKAVLTLVAYRSQTESEMISQTPVGAANSPSSDPGKNSPPASGESSSSPESPKSPSGGEGS
jgi:Tfp pilus assembly protein PilO